MLRVSDSGDSFEKELPSAGIQPAVCSKVFDLGRQVSEYNGERNIKHKVLFIWELAETMKEGEYAGKRFVVHKEYTASLHPKSTLRKDLESWKGKSIPEETAKEGIDLEKMVKMPATLMIQHKTAKSSGNEYAIVSSVMPEQANSPMMVPELPSDWCPKWIQGKMDEALNDDAVKPGDMSRPQSEEQAIF